MSDQLSAKTVSPGRHILLGIVATGAGLFLAAAPGYNAFLAYSMQSWKLVPAAVTRIRPGELGAGGRWAALRGESGSVLTIRYFVDGNYTTSDQTVVHAVMAGPTLVNDSGQTQPVYVGQRVQCYYNPASPEWSRLSPPKNEWYYWLPAVGAGAVGITNLFHGITGYARRRRFDASNSRENSTEFLH